MIIIAIIHNFIEIHLIKTQLTILALGIKNTNYKILKNIK